MDCEDLENASDFHVKKAPITKKSHKKESSCFRLQTDLSNSSEQLSKMKKRRCEQSSDFIFRDHEVHRTMRYTPDEMTFSSPLKYVDVTRQKNKHR